MLEFVEGDGFCTFGDFGPPATDQGRDDLCSRLSQAVSDMWNFFWPFLAEELPSAEWDIDETVEMGTPFVEEVSSKCPCPRHVHEAREVTSDGIALGRRVRVVSLRSST